MHEGDRFLVVRGADSRLISQLSLIKPSADAGENPARSCRTLNILATSVDSGRVFGENNLPSTERQRGVAKPEKQKAKMRAVFRSSLGLAALLVLLFCPQTRAAVAAFDELVPLLSPQVITCKSSMATSGLGLPVFNQSTFPSRVDLGPVCLRQQGFTCASASHSEVLVLSMLACDTNAGNDKKASTCCSKLAALRCYGAEGVVGILGASAGQMLPVCSSFAKDLYRSCSAEGLFFVADESAVLTSALPQLCGESDILCAPFSELYADVQKLFTALGMRISGAGGIGETCWDNEGTKFSFVPSVERNKEIVELAQKAGLLPAGVAGGGFKATARKRRSQKEEDSAASPPFSQSTEDLAFVDQLRRLFFAHTSPLLGKRVAIVLAKNLELVLGAFAAILSINWLSRRMNRKANSGRYSGNRGYSANAAASVLSGGSGLGDLSEKERQIRLAAIQRRFQQQQQEQHQSSSAGSRSNGGSHQGSGENGGNDDDSDLE
jgi:hypothetical protein